MRKIYEQDEFSKKQGIGKEELVEGAKKVREILDKPYVEFIKALTGKSPSESTLAEIDPKVKAILNMGKKDLNLEDEIVKVNLQASFPVKQLHPTQSQIGLLDSIGWPAFVDPKNSINALQGAAKFIKKGNEERILTANGKWILDGHHRWSQTFILNPNATIPCVDITLSAQEPTDFLKIIQMAIAAAYGHIYMKSANAKTDIFSDEIVNQNNGLRGLLVNIFEGKFGVPEGGDKKNVNNFLRLVYDNMPEERKAQGSQSEGDLSKEMKKSVIDYLSENAMLLRKENKSFTDKAPARIYMPQPGDTRSEVGVEGKDVSGIPAEVIDKLQSGNLNFKKALTPGEAKKTTESKKSDRKYLKTFEQFTRYRNQ